jgi:hypothetical protein
MHRRRMDLASACRTGSTTGEGVHTKLGTFLEERYDDPRSDRAIILYIDIETFGGGGSNPYGADAILTPATPRILYGFIPPIPLRGWREQRGGGGDGRRGKGPT